VTDSGGTGWTIPDVRPTLVPGELHVWRIGLDPPVERLPALRRLLTPDENDRADRFYFEIDRNRFIAAHAALRALLGDYLGGGLCREPFRAGRDGKPELASSGGLRFNLSHSRNLGLAAFAAGQSVGVDLEAIDRDVEVEAIAERFFSAPERRALLGLPEAKWRDGFFHLWSQKEAYLKGRGDGVIHGLDHFDMVADPDQPAALLVDRRDVQATGRWRVYSCDPGAGFRGAVAIEGEPAVLRRFAWR
jgi:4'-phosphopantetheinyl transferase